MSKDDSDTIPGHVPVQGTQERSWRRQDQLSRTVKRRISIFCRLPTASAPKEEQTETSAYTTTSDAGSLLRKSATASGRPGSDRKQPSIKVVTVKFGLSKGE